MPEQVFQEVINNVGRGIYYGSAITDMPMESATLLRNMVIKQGQYVGNRNGYTLFSGSQIKTNNVPVAITGLYEYNFQTTRTMLVKFGADLYTYNESTGAFTDTGVNLNTGSYAHFQKYYDSVIISDGVNLPIRYNGSVFTELSTAPKFRVCEPINGNLFGVDISSEPDATYFSDFLAPTSWPAINVRKVPESTFDTFKCIRKINDDVLALALSEEEIWMLVGRSGRNYQFYSLAKNIGTVSAETVQVRNGMIIWLDQDGFYTLGENRMPVKFSQLNEIFKTLDMTRLSNAWAVTYKGNADTGNQYWCGLTFGTGYTKNNVVFVYDFNSGGWTWFTNIPCDIMTVGLDTNRNEVLYGVSDDGWIYQLDNGDNDNGKSISSAYITRPIDFGMPGEVKQFKDAIIFYRSKYPVTLRVMVTADFGELTSPDDGTTESFTLKGEPTPLIQYETDALEFEDSFLREAYAHYIEVPVKMRGRHFQMLVSCRDGAQDFDIYKIVCRGPAKGSKQGNE